MYNWTLVFMIKLAMLSNISPNLQTTICKTRLWLHFNMKPDRYSPFKTQTTTSIHKYTHIMQMFPVSFMGNIVLHWVFLPGSPTVILTVVFNLKKSLHQLQGGKQYVCGHTDQTANISSEVTDLAWDWIRHGWRTLLHYERGGAMFPW